MIITLIIIIVMMMICWLKRTGATTWRSLGLLRLLLLCFILFFSAVVFELWYKSVLAITPCHSTSIILLPQTDQRFNSHLGPEGLCSYILPAPSALWLSENLNLGKSTEGRRGRLLRDQFISVLGFLGSALVPLDFVWCRLWLCPF